MSAIFLLKEMVERQRIHEVVFSDRPYFFAKANGYNHVVADVHTVTYNQSFLRSRSDGVKQRQLLLILLKLTQFTLHFCRMLEFLSMR